MVVKCSPDVGNSSTKAIFADENSKKARKQPSVVGYLAKEPQFEDEEVDVLVGNLHKNIVVHITSEAIKRNGRYAVGNIGNILGGDGFDIKKHKKADKDLTIIQPLSMLAVNAVQNEYAATKELPKALSVDVEYASAIPVVDYSKTAAKALEERLKGTHIIIVYVGEGLKVTVTINIVKAKIVQEGIPAFYAILQGSKDLFEKYNQRYKVNFSGKDFANRKILFVDIGEGTLELIAVIDGVPVVIKSAGYRLGVGHASENALVTFKDVNDFRADITRSNFMGKVLDANDKWHTEAKQELDFATDEQEEKIYDALTGHIEGVLQNDLDDIVVFGGGTNVFTDLENTLVDYANKYKMRVLWIAGKEASLLNAIGLDELNQKVFFKKKAGE